MVIFVARKTGVIVVCGWSLLFWRQFDDLAIKSYDICLFGEAEFLYFLKPYATALYPLFYWNRILITWVINTFGVRFALLVSLVLGHWPYFLHPLLFDVIFLMDDSGLLILLFWFTARLLLFRLQGLPFIFTMSLSVDLLGLGGTQSILASTFFILMPMAMWYGFNLFCLTLIIGKHWLWNKK